MMLVVALAVLTAGAQTKAQLKELFRPMCDAIVRQIEPSSTMKGTLSVEKVAVKGGRLQIHFSRYISDHPLRQNCFPWRLHPGPCRWRGG